MKELYQSAEMDLICFSMADVITTSIETEPTIIPPTLDENTLDMVPID